MSWEYTVMGNNPSKVSYLHLFVPYKRWEWVIEDLVKSVSGAVSYFNERGEYSAKIIKKKEDSNNCEHYANGVIHGIFVSNYAEKYKVKKKLPYGKKIKKYNDAKKMIEESRKFFQSLVVNEEEVKRITDLVNKYISSVQLQNEMKFYVEVPRINKSYRYKL